MSEEEIINILSDEIVSLNVGHEKYEQAVKGLLDLYNKEKEKNNGLEIKANELNNLADVVKRDYIHKNKIKPMQIIDLDGKIHNVYKIEEE